MATLSVIVPLYNEEDNVARLCQLTQDALTSAALDYELLLVDDGSTDRTCEVARRIARADTRVRVVELRRNSGQTAAMSAGIDLARGDILVTMDGDLQNDPRDIPKLVHKLEEGFDLVAGYRVNRQDKFITRKIPSRLANWLIGKVTGIRIRDNGCSLKSYRADVIKRVPLYSEMHRFIPAMSSTVGARIVEVPVRHHPRIFGRSKYGLSRTYKVLLDLTTIRAVGGYANRPLVWFAKVGMLPALFAAGFIVTAIYRAFAIGDLSLSLLGSALMLLVAVGFLLMLGTLSELVKRMAPPDLDSRITACASVWDRSRLARGKGGNR